MGRRVTIREVAKRANVSIATVSNYLNQNHRKMSSETSARVARAIEDLGYHPSLGARSLPRKSVTQTICIVIPHNVDYTFHHPYFAEVMRGISAVIDGAGYRALIVTSKSKERSETDYIQGLAHGLIDGAIFFDIEPQDAYVHEFAGSQFPIMIVGRTEETNHFVDADIESGVAEATDHLLNLGHRSIALVSGPENLVFSHQLVRGYRFALERRGVRADDGLVSFGPFSEEDGLRKVQALFSSGAPPTGVVSGSGKQTLGMLEYLRQRSIEVPRDVSIVSFGHDPLIDLRGLSLTHLEQPESEIGRTVAQNLLALIDDPLRRFEPTILPLELIVGDSTAAVS